MEIISKFIGRSLPREVPAQFWTMSTTAPKTYWKQLIHPLTTWQYLLIMVGSGTVLGMILNTETFFESVKGAVLVIFWVTSHTFVQWTGNTMVVRFLDERISWVERPRRRLFAGLVFQCLYSLVGYMAVQLLYEYLFFGRFPADIIGWVIANSPTTIFISLSISTVATLMGFLRSWRRSEIQAEQFRTEMQRYKYEALRAQLNPHFLFNSFNVLGDLIYEDADQAALFLQRLSNLYRYVLDSRDKELVPLERELEFAQAFSYLLETRFEGKLKVEIDVKGEGHEQLVPMSLQLLIENAVKHNEVSKAHPLRVEVVREGEWLVVRNPLRKRDVGDDSKGTGLANLEAQYARYSDRGLQVKEGSVAFEVRVPIIKEGKA